MKKIIAYSFIVALLFSDCKKPKDLPEPEVNDPHFYVNCHVDGTPLNIQAGNDDYYMNASWYRVDTQSMYVYKADLAKQTGSGYQVTILLNDFKNTDAAESMLPDSALWVGEHLYNDQNKSDITQNIRFKPVRPYSSPAVYSWTMTNGTDQTVYAGNSDGQNSVICPVCEVGKTYTVTMDYNDNTGVCSSQLTNVFKAGSRLQTTISAEKDSASPELAYTFSYSGYYPGVTCTWEFPGQTITSDAKPKRIFQPGQKYMVKLRLTDGQDTCISYYQLDAMHPSQPCDANYTAAFSRIRNKRAYASATVLLTDPNGVVYSSGELVQSPGNKFYIEDVSDYKANEKGQYTKKLKVRFNCIVKNGSKEISLTNGEGMVAVAFK